VTGRPIVRWTDALDWARQIVDRCWRSSTPDAGGRRAVQQSTVELWALPIYAIAHQTGNSVTMVTAAQLRYRLHDRNAYTMWLFEQLDRMGHQVDHPTYPDFVRGRRADAHAARVESQLLRDNTSPQADDPVVRYWRQAILFTADTTEATDTTITTNPATCDLWSHRPEMIRLLDTLLVIERGGWPAGTRVRTHGVPHYVSPTGQLASECGVSPDRAIINAPSWALDHDRQTLADGPAAAYFLEFRRLDDHTIGTTVPFGPIPSTNLTVDVDAFPGPAGPPQLVVPERPPTWPAAAAHADAQGGAQSKDDVRSDESDRLPLDELRPDRTELPRAMANTDDPFRAAAIYRVWTLRDKELSSVGDSTPRRIAERIANRSYPDPEPSLSSRELATHERLDLNGQERPRAPWCEPDQQLVTGQPRKQLLQWLRAMSNATSKQCRALDGLGPDSHIAAAREFLASEGFVEVLDARGNVDSGHGGVDLICVNAPDGLIATVTGSDPWGKGTQLHSIAVCYNIAALDEELVWARGGEGGTFFDSNRHRTNLLYGTFTVYPRDGWSHCSLRTALAVLRAFTRPITPWIHPVRLTLGTDGVPDDERRSIIARLPEEVRELFGTMLTPGRRSNT
jgi:hypothetical protein